MQTFLPYENFQQCAKVLDKKRCWKQVVEAKQILCTLKSPNLPESWIKSKSYQKQRWINHPAVQMWKGYEYALMGYYNIFLAYCLEVHKIKTKLPFLEIFTDGTYIKPWWLGVEKLHQSHRSRLIEKNYNFYITEFSFGDYKFNNGNYFWPVNESKTFKLIIRNEKRKTRIQKQTKHLS